MLFLVHCETYNVSTIPGSFGKLILNFKTNACNYFESLKSHTINALLTFRILFSTFVKSEFIFFLKFACCRIISQFFFTFLIFFHPWLLRECDE